MHFILCSAIKNRIGSQAWLHKKLICLSIVCMRTKLDLNDFMFFLGLLQIWMLTSIMFASVKRSNTSTQMHIAKRRRVACKYACSVTLHSNEAFGWLLLPFFFFSLSPSLWCFIRIRLFPVCIRNIQSKSFAASDQRRIKPTTIPICESMCMLRIAMLYFILSSCSHKKPCVHSLAI